MDLESDDLESVDLESGVGESGVVGSKAASAVPGQGCRAFL